MGEKANNIRFDLSDFLIHFVRPVESGSDDAPPDPEDWGWGNEVEGLLLSPFFLLRCIVRQGRIWATWSFRKGRPTIYGRRPAVCLTEMPLAAFVQSGRARAARGEKMSPFGLLLRKTDLYRLGARPVIYGLSQEVSNRRHRDGTRRLPTDALPLDEQYRYVAYDPTRAGRLDWTHEREWRWPLEGTSNPGSCPDPIYATDIPGLDLYRGAEGINGAGAIVRSNRQAKLLVHDILQLADRGIVEEGTFRFILKLDGLPPVDRLWQPSDVQRAIASNIVNLAPYFEEQTQDRQLVDGFRALVRQVAGTTCDVKAGEPGGCWLWMHDNTHPLVRALLRDGRVVVSDAGRYLAQMREFDDGLGLAALEDLTRTLARKVKATFGTECGYFSILGSDDINGLPFYCGDILDEEIYTNYAHKPEDS